MSLTTLPAVSSHLREFRDENVPGRTRNPAIKIHDESAAAALYRLGVWKASNIICSYRKDVYGILHADCLPEKSQWYSCWTEAVERRNHPLYSSSTLASISNTLGLYVIRWYPGLDTALTETSLQGRDSADI